MSEFKKGPPDENATPCNNARIRNWRVDGDGFLRVTAHVLKEGVYPYTAEESFGAEEALPGIDPVMQYIPLAAFTPEALATLEGKPVTVPHMAPGEEWHQWRDPGNALKDCLTVGNIAGRPRVTSDGCVECDMLIMDPGAIRDIKAANLVEVSAGYHGVFSIQEGAFGGRSYHGKQGDLRFNHVLLLPEGAGRCGRDVRIINQKPEEDPPMPTPQSIRLMLGNKARTLKFSNEEDAKTAENALEEQGAFNADALQTAMAEIKDLENKLAEQKKVLEEANRKIEELLSPAAQEALAQEVADQKEDEAAIIEAETENSPAPSAPSGPSGESAPPPPGAEKEKEAFANALRACGSLAARRAALVTRVMNSRGADLRGWTQQAFDGAFEVMAANARAAARAKAADARKTGNRAPLGITPAGTGGTGGTPISAGYAGGNRERMLRPMRAANSLPEAK